MTRDTLDPSDTIRDLAESALLVDLNHAELIVYVRLVAFNDCGMMTPKNKDLHSDTRAVRRALLSLAKRKLITVRYARNDHRVRTIEVE